MATQDLSAVALAGSVSGNVMNLGNNASLYFDVGGWLGFSFDMNMISTAASGTINVYGQDTLPVGDTNARVPIATYTVASGNFGTISGVSSVTSVTVDSNNVTARKYIVVKWVGTDGGSPVGTLTFVGFKQIF